MKKPAKLNLYQMWDMYLLNQSTDMVRVIPRSLKILYPETDFSNFDINEKTTLYFAGLSQTLYFYFQSFISKVKSHGK